MLQANGGIGPGFDLLRLALALSVVVFHSFQLTYGRGWNAGNGVAGLAVVYVVPTFFALSGFLVAGSMVRLGRVWTFLAFRALRIVPALAAEIALSAVLLGALFTAFPLAAYFTDPGFWRYFSNALGIIRYELPGVFLNLPVANVVNGQLWTVPSELYCYLALAALMAMRIATRRWLLLGAFLVLAIGECVLGLLPGRHYTAGVLQSAESLVLCFLFGVVLYLFRDEVPVSLPLFLAAILAGALTARFVPVLALLIGPMAAGYVAVYLGLRRVPRLPLVQGGDYSYGVYLYSFPLQQAIVATLPGLREWYWNLPIAAVAALLFAMLSWHLVEKPALRARRFLVPSTPEALRASPSGRTANGGAS